MNKYQWHQNQTQGIFVSFPSFFTEKKKPKIHVKNQIENGRFCYASTDHSRFRELILVGMGRLVKIFVNDVLEIGHEPKGEVIKLILSVIYLFFFAFFAKITHGGACNPLTVLSSAISVDFSQFLLTIGARIPAQVIGSITGVRLILETFPEIGFGPRLKVDLHHGALTEGLLTSAIVTISLGLGKRYQGVFSGRLGSLASVMGWAYAHGDHISKEHMVVYWLAPMGATLLAVWTVKLLVRHVKKEKKGESD